VIFDFAVEDFHRAETGNCLPHASFYGIDCTGRFDEEEHSRPCSAQCDAEDTFRTRERQKAREQRADFAAIGLMHSVTHGFRDEFAASGGEGRSENGDTLQVSDDIGAVVSRRENGSRGCGGERLLGYGDERFPCRGRR
jgi:hypothetical protein